MKRIRCRRMDVSSFARCVEYDCAIYVTTGVLLLCLSLKCDPPTDLHRRE